MDGACDFAQVVKCLAGIHCDQILRHAVGQALSDRRETPSGTVLQSVASW